MKRILVAETIERVAEADKYDVIVVESRSPENRAAGYMGNSVSEHVAAHARMTVVIAR
jgi:nucleotide-binding universal stress UspA family protein